MRLPPGAAASSWHAGLCPCTALPERKAGGFCPGCQDLACVSAKTLLSTTPDREVPTHSTPQSIRGHTREDAMACEPLCGAGSGAQPVPGRLPLLSLELKLSSTHLGKAGRLCAWVRRSMALRGWQEQRPLQGREGSHCIWEGKEGRHCSEEGEEGRHCREEGEEGRHCSGEALSEAPERSGQTEESGKLPALSVLSLLWPP